MEGNNVILFKRSSVPNRVPEVSALSAGEIAVNVTDGTLFTKKIVNGVEEIVTFSNSEANPYSYNPSFSSIVVTDPSHYNTVSQVFATVLGGYYNDVSGGGSTVINGENNDIAGDYAFIGSGADNKITANGDYSAILGGQNNLVSHQNSFTIGSNLSSHAENFTYVNNISGTLWGDGGNITSIDATNITSGTLNATRLPVFEGDITTSTGTASATVVAIQGHPVSVQNPANGQILQWNGTAWVPGSIATGGSGGGGIVYYFNYANYTNISPTNGLPTSPVAPSLLGREYSVGSGSLQSGELTQNVYTLVAGFVSLSSEPAVTNIPAGLWDFNIWVDIVGNSSVNQTSMQIRVYKYTSSTSTYTPLASSGNLYIYDPTVIAQYIASVTMPQTTLLSSDRIYIEFWAAKSVNQSRHIRFWFDSSHPSHVHTTLPSVVGSGLVKVINGVYQSPASLLVNTDVADNAAIDQSKINGLTDVANKANSTYTTVQTNSANWDAAYSSAGTDLMVRSLTGLWDSTYNTVGSLSSNWNTAYLSTTALNLSSSNWNTTFTNVQSNSANWNLVAVSDPLIYTFTGNGVTTNYTISGTNSSSNAACIDVYVENVKQEPISSYTLSADIVKFTEPPEAGTGIVIITPNVKLVNVFLSGSYVIPQFSNQQTSTQILLSSDLWNFTSELVSLGGGKNTTNIATGTNALKSNISGNFNAAYGFSSLYSNTDGINNIAIGAASLYYNTNGYGNVAVGRDVLYNNTTGIENMGLGYRALFNCNSNWNVGVGTFALFNTTNGERNVGVGKDAAISNTTGEGIVAVGDRTAASVINKNNITAVGRQALFQITGDENTAVGAFSQCNFLSPNAANGVGSKNTSLGYSSLGYLTSGSNNVAVGYTSLLNTLTGNNNTAVGYEALHSTDYVNTAGIGYQAAVTGNNQVQLGNSSTTTYVYGSVQDRSDARDKTEIRDTTLGLEFINKLRPVDFKWDYRDDYKPAPPVFPGSNATEEEVQTYKKELADWTEACKLCNIESTGIKKRNRFHHGLIAQEVKSILDAENIDFGGFQNHAINGGDDVLSIGYIELVAPLIKSVQELTTKLEQAQNEIHNLKTEINNLKS
jgi:hypothetical protein